MRCNCTQLLPGTILFPRLLKQKHYPDETFFLFRISFCQKAKKSFNRNSVSPRPMPKTIGELQNETLRTMNPIEEGAGFQSPPTLHEKRKQAMPCLTRYPSTNPLVVCLRFVVACASEPNA